MKVVIVGCGRVGSGVAKQLAVQGWDVTCIDEDEGALARLGEWRGGFVVGHGMPATGGALRVEPVEVPQLTSFGESLDGNQLYAVSQSGTVSRFAR